MPSYEPEPDRIWDEYEWERFLQQQDYKTEKYMELLEKYLDHPQRDQIIAQEMGWTQLLKGDDWSDEVDALLADESSTAEDVHSVPPSSRLRTCQPRARKNCSTRSRMPSSSPRTSMLACSGIFSMFTARSGGSLAGITRLNVQTASESRMRPMMPT